MKRYKTATGSSIESITYPKKIHFKEFDLNNGLHCILHKDNRNPIVNVTVAYKVGSKDENVNKKGIAHLFEHLMFQGSDNVKKNEHFNYVMKSGGVCNAFTMHDMTVYFELMPSNSFEISLWLESERMNSLNISEDNLLNQKNVVIEEKKQIHDNAPYGTTIKNIFENIFRGSGYESAVIGEVSDINSFSSEEAMNFHNNYYSPENSVLMVSGDIDYDNAEKLIRKYFTGIEKQNTIIRKKNNIVCLSEDIDLQVYDNVQLSFLNLCYQIPPIGNKSNYSLDYLGEIIANNKSSRLYKKLVYEKKFLKSIKAVKYELEDAGIFLLRAMINPGVDVEDIKNEIFKVINDLAEQGCTDEEFQKVKNQIEFDNTVKHIKLQNISIETIFNYHYFKDTNRINSEMNKYLSVTKQDIKNSVNDFIKNKNKLILTYLPKN
ncbi:MAG: pitrilysin family protein [bacterium]